MKQVLKIFSLGCFLFGQALMVKAQVFPMEIFSYGNSPDRAVNITIMGDGYQAHEQEKFIEDSKKAFEVMLIQEPWKSFPGRFNIYAIKVPSNVSGAANSPDDLIDNYFKTTFNYAGIERLLVPMSYSRVLGVLNSNTPFYDAAVIIVNDVRYGGSGGSFATFSTGPYSEEIMIHELGHSFAQLSDEYWVGDAYARETANMTQDNNPLTNTWRNFLTINEVSIYPHEESPSWYRPHQNCKMRFLNRDFCLVCLNEFDEKIELLTQESGLERPIPFFGANKLEIYASDSIDFFDLSTEIPEEWEWNFEGGLPATSSSQYPTVTYEKEGSYAVTLKAKNAVGENSYTRTGFIRVINDLIPPEIKLKKVVIELDANGQASLNAEDVNDGTNDNNAVKKISISKTLFDCSNLGENTIVFKAEDFSGNESTSEVIVTVVDKIKPTVKTKNINLKLDESGKANLTADMLDDGSFDNCGIESYTISKTEITTENLGLNTDTLTVKDYSGNVATGTSTVTVDIVLGLEKEEDHSIKLYPNPASDRLKIEFLNGLDFTIKSIEIIDIRGVLLNEIKEFKEVNNGIELDVRNLKNGSYFIRIHSSNSIKTLRFVVNK